MQPDGTFIKYNEELHKEKIMQSNEFTGDGIEISEDLATFAVENVSS